MAQKSRRRAPAWKSEFVGRLLGEQQIARVLDRLRDGALLAGGKAGVFAGEDLASVSDVTAHQLRSGERKVLGREAVFCFCGFGRAAHKSRVGQEAMRSEACQQVCLADENYQKPRHCSEITGGDARQSPRVGRPGAV